MILLRLLFTFFKVGLFSFGGGYAMLPLIFQEVNKVGSMSADTFNELVGLSQVTPGPLAINAATYSGFQVAGIPGTIVSTFGVVLPEFILIMILLRFLEKYRQSSIMEGAFSGIRPATVGLMAAAVTYLAKGNLVADRSIAQIASDPAGFLNIVPLIFFAAALIASGGFKLSAMKTMLGMGACGALLYGLTDIPLP